MKPQLTIPQWLSIKASTRAALAERFKLPKSGFSSVVDNRLMSDGYSHEDLAHLTVDSLKEATNYPSENFYVLLDNVIMDIENPVQKASDEDIKILKNLEHTIATLPTKRKPGRPRKNV